MRLHSNVIGYTQTIRNAAKHLPGVNADVSPHDSRSRAYAFEVKLTGTSPRRPNSGQHGAGYDDYAATWDEWGMFLTVLFEIDPDMIVGSPGRPIYASRDHFRWATGNRYDMLEPEDQCRTHKFEAKGRSATGSYWVSECRKCHAITRRGDWALVLA